MVLKFVEPMVNVSYKIKRWLIRNPLIEFLCPIADDYDNFSKLKRSVQGKKSML